MKQPPATKRALLAGAALIGYLATGVLLTGNAFGQSQSTTIYSQPRTAVLDASAERAHAQTTIRQTSGLAAVEAESVPSTFPSLNPRPINPDAAENEEGGAVKGKMTAPAITVASSLAVVLGLFAALVWGSRRFGNGSIHKGSIPKEVMQPLGSAALDPRTRVTMLRCGERILVLAQTASSAHPICEITDPEEVNNLTAACLGNSKHEFASALRSIEREQPSQGYAGSEARRESQPARRRLFASA